VFSPRFGDLLAVIIELPLILSISWLTCAVIVSRGHVPATASARLIMGSTAFALLMASEFILGTFGFGRSLAEQLSRYRHAPERIGLAGQLLFAGFPLLQLKLQRRQRA
jgi:hypothetical protein